MSITELNPPDQLNQLKQQYDKEQQLDIQMAALLNISPVELEDKRPILDEPLEPFNASEAYSLIPFVADMFTQMLIQSTVLIINEFRRGNHKIKVKDYQNAITQLVNILKQSQYYNNRILGFTYNQYKDQHIRQQKVNNVSSNNE